jgi:NAD(P)-dependent dehydrogenase (short-subunit alcohol dehydrogenase family)
VTTTKHPSPTDTGSDASRVVIVTGGGSGIGRATALAFFEQGCDVVVADINPTSAEITLEAASTSDRLRPEAGTRRPSRMIFARTDVRREADIEAMVSTAVETFGRLDVLVNNAGVGGAFGPVSEIEVEDWDFTFEVLLRSVFLGVKHAARVMQAGSAIVNVASNAAYASGYAGVAYTAAKAGVRSLTQSVSIELAPRGIRVNSVSPGVTRTPLLDGGNDDALRDVDPPQPIARWGRPEDIAAAITFLAGSGASFATGADLLVDGGLTALGPGPEFQRRLHMNATELGLVGVNRGSTGERSQVHRRL